MKLSKVKLFLYLNNGTLFFLLGKRKDANNFLKYQMFLTSQRFYL